jgi:guanylate kinase
MQRGELFILSAPSGAGKTTLIQALLTSGLATGDGEIAFSVSHTTRSPRGGEQDGEDYHFVDRARFEAMVDEGRFLEWAEVHGNLYGTAWDEVTPRLERGADVVLDIDVQGAEIVMARFPEAQSVLVLPPSYADLQRRLRRRGLDGADVIARRLAASVREIERYECYRYVIVNDDAQKAAYALAAVIIARRHSLGRMRGPVEAVLADFRAAALGGASQT